MRLFTTWSTDSGAVVIEGGSGLESAADADASNEVSNRMDEVVARPANLPKDRGTEVRSVLVRCVLRKTARMTSSTSGRR